MNLILEQLMIWAPTVVSILGIVTTVILAINKCVDAIEALKKDSTIKELNEKLQEEIRENKELKENVSLMLDKITQIKDYTKNKRGE